jgi:hypothetical protein
MSQVPNEIALKLIDLMMNELHIGVDDAVTDEHLAEMGAILVGVMSYLGMVTKATGRNFEAMMIVMVRRILSDADELAAGYAARRVTDKAMREAGK